jgi:glycosyltransferase involved in cell wall biosynthesis
LEPFEGVPRVIDESIMHKVPVIATKVGGIDMEFEPHEIFKIAPDEGELQQAVEEMLINEETYKKYVLGLEKRYRWLKENPNAAAQHAKIIKSTKL